MQKSWVLKHLRIATPEMSSGVSGKSKLSSSSWMGTFHLNFLTDIYTLLQGWKCCKFRNSNLSCCRLSMVFDRSALSDLRPWHPHSTFLHTTAAYLYFWGRGNPCKPYGCDAVKIPVDQHFVKYSNQHIWHQQLHHIDSRLNLVSSSFWYSSKRPRV